MPGVLLVHQGTSADAHPTGAVDWSPALQLSLEKHGYLELEVAGPAVLEDPSVFDRYAAVLVGRLDPARWTPDILRRAVASRGLVVVDGPAPAAVLEVLGVDAVSPADGDGSIMVADPGIRARAAELGLPIGGHVRGPTIREQDLEASRAWARRDEVPIDGELARRWRRPGWAVEAWSMAAGDRVLAYWQTDGHSRPALVRRGGLVGCCFGLLSYIGQAHTCDPAEPGEYRSGERVTGLEAIVLALIDQAHRDAGHASVRVRPWPAPYEWVLSIRHDFDRPLTETQVRDVLARHSQAGTAGTWYWLSRHLDSPALRTRVRRGASPRPAIGAAESRRALTAVAADDRHEVAHHTMQLWDGAEEEQRVVERVAGRTMRGTSAHGDATCFRWQGAPNVLWAERQGMLYTELLQQAHLHPHRFAALRGDGAVEALRVICLPHHESFDRSTAEGDHAAEFVAGRAAAFREAGGVMQVLNHPDIHVEPLFECLTGIPRAGRLDWTAEQVADWWSRTHVLGNLRFERRGADLVVMAERSIDDLVIEVRLPGGECATHVAGLEAGTPFVLAGALTGSGSDR